MPMSVASPGPFKLIFFDIDGTLIGPEGRYSAAVQQAIFRVQRRGLVTAVASGRPPFACQHLFHELNLTNPGLFHAGAAIYNPVSKQYLQSTPLPDEGLRPFLEAAQAAGAYAEVYLQHGYVVDHTSDIQRAHARALHCEPQIGCLFEAIDHGPVFKLLVGVDQRAQPHTLAELERAFPEYHFAYARMVSHPDWLFASVINGAVDKNNAFDYLCAHYGVAPEQVMAFGDAEADTVFLQRAGMGVAMGNASAAVKASADYCAPSVEEDGVARALVELLPTESPAP